MRIHHGYLRRDALICAAKRETCFYQGEKMLISKEKLSVSSKNPILPTLFLTREDILLTKNARLFPFYSVNFFQCDIYCFKRKKLRSYYCDSLEWIKLKRTKFKFYHKNKLEVVLSWTSQICPVRNSTSRKNISKVKLTLNFASNTGWRHNTLNLFFF